MANSSFCPNLFLATCVVTCLMTSCNSLLTKEKKPARSDESLLLGAVSEIEDALTRLNQYAKSLKAEQSTEKDDDDPLAESMERESRDEDYRQEPELVPGLDRFEKNLEDTREPVGTSGKAGQKSAADRQGKDNADDFSLQDLLNYLQRTKEGNANGRETEAKSTTRLQPGSSSKDISLQELLDFLKEHQSHNKDQSGLSAETQTKTVNRDDTSDMSLKEALQYLVSLKKKLKEEKTE